MTVRLFRSMSFVPLVPEAHYVAIASDREELAVPNRHRLCDGAAIVLGRNLTVIEDQVCRLLIHGRLQR